MKSVEVLIIGGGPCGLSAAIEVEKKGFEAVIIEKGNIVNSIYNYPTHQTFFSSSLKLSIGDMPFITAKHKPQRLDALVYYRQVAELKDLTIQTFEEVLNVEKREDGRFTVTTTKDVYDAQYVVVATGYYDHPNRLNVPGEELPHVHHYFKEAHPYFKRHVVIIGGKNSAIDAGIELAHAGAHVTVVYRGPSYSPSIKPWVLPEFESLVRHEKITMHFNTNVTKITEENVYLETEGREHSVLADTVFAMIGYHPDHDFIRRMGVNIDEVTGEPHYNPETMESNVPGLFIAGVIAAGNDANTIFIENGRFHGCQIAATISEELK